MIAVSRSGRAWHVVAATLMAGGLLCRGAIAWGGGTVILPASGENISAPIIDWARAHLVSRLGIHGGERLGVIDLKGPPTHEPPTAIEAVAAAHAVGADHAITFHLAHHREETWLTLTSYAADGNATPFRLTERVATGPESLPPIIDRMAFALVFPEPGPPPLSTMSASGGAVTAVVRRPPRETFVGVGAGLQVALNTAARDNLWLPSATLFVMKLNAAWMADARFEYGSANPWYVTSLGAGLYLPLLTSAASASASSSSGSWSSVYVGGGARWTWLQMGGRSANGLALHPTIGWFHRMGPWPVLRVEFAYVANLFGELEPDRLIPGSGAGHVSHGPRFTVGMAF